jgi:hypothetical protein
MNLTPMSRVNRRFRRWRSRFEPSARVAFA